MRSSIEKDNYPTEIPKLQPEFEQVRIAIDSFTYIKKYKRILPDSDNYFHGNFSSPTLIKEYLNGVNLFLIARGTFGSSEEEGVDSNWRKIAITKRDYVLLINGSYIIDDEKEGAVEIFFVNGERYGEAYYSKDDTGKISLQQVVSPKGKVFNVDNLSDSPEDISGVGMINIPESEFNVPLEKKARFT